MPEVGRFGQVVPVTETQENYSLYQYGWGTLVFRSDPNGDCPLCPAIPLLPEIATGIATAFKVVAGSTFVVAVGVRLKELTSAGNLGGGGYSPSLGMAMSTTSPGEITSMMKSSSKSKSSDVTSNSSNDGNQKETKGKNGGTFGAGKDTKDNGSSKASLINAKEQNGIPRSQQPDKTIKPNTPAGDKAKLDSRNKKQYEYTNSKGEKKSIREDKSAKYNDGGKGDQGKHYNAGNKGGKLGQHHSN